MIDETDQQLLLCLRKNGRIKLSEIVRQTGIPLTTVFQRMREFDKYVVKNATLLDFEKMGFSVRVFIAAKSSDKEALQDFLFSNKNINTVSRTSNSHDFFFEAIFSTMRDFALFNDTLQLLKARIKLYFVVEEIARECFLSQKGHMKLLT
jgi:DNA-binding Lrp family transcriptional regulator